MEMKFIPKSEFERVRAATLPWETKLPLLARMNRLNTLFEVKRAGSGHLGSSFSAMDIVVFLYEKYMNVTKVGVDSPDRDIYFSSKGHDAPGLYAVLYSLGIVPEEKFLALRRLGGLDGHPDVLIRGVEANTGSLGMGISKGRGMAFAKRFQGHGGRVIVMTGDGEFQEGQNFEALQSTVQQKEHNVLVVMDHNKLQSDRLIDRIVSLQDLEKKLTSFGWFVLRCDGHDYAKLEECFRKFESVTDKPKFLICDTIKGSGVSFMEHPKALEDNNGFFKWHSGAPDDVSYAKAYEELLAGVENSFHSHGLGRPARIDAEPEKRPGKKVSTEVVAEAYGQALVAMAPEIKNFVVLDADLSFDCKLRTFEDTYPNRFVEMGIAEQDMVSMACGIAGKGLLPICNSFANFMAARANEQIYNAQTEARKIIYACHYAGLIPAGPGKSHQAIRDISLFAALPNVTIVQACNAQEMNQATRWAVQGAQESVMMRINIGPSPREIQLPKDYKWQQGRGARLVAGQETVVFSYGPVMLHEVLLAQELLAGEGFKIAVVNMPWLNRFDREWLASELQGFKNVVFVEDHSPVGGLGDHMMSFLNDEGLTAGRRFKKIGVEGYPACGTPWEALAYHGMDGESLAERIRAFAKGEKSRVESGVMKVDKRRPSTTYGGLDEHAQL